MLAGAKLQEVGCPYGRLNAKEQSSGRPRFNGPNRPNSAVYPLAGKVKFGPNPVTGLRPSQPRMVRAALGLLINAPRTSAVGAPAAAARKRTGRRATATGR